MSKSFKYVKEFEFPSDCGFSGSAGKTMVKGYYRGGEVEKMGRGGKMQAERALKNENKEMARVKMETRSERKDAGDEMKRIRREERYDEAKLRQPMRKQYPVNRSEPMIPMKKGGMTPAQDAKVGKVMGEYKEGKLHSGSKTGPKVKNRQQALAIAMSEARKGKK